MSGSNSSNGIGSTLPGFVLDLPLVGLEWVEVLGESVGIGMIGNRVVTINDSGIRWTHDHATADIGHGVAECHTDILAHAREEAAMLAALPPQVLEMVQAGMPLQVARMLAGGVI